MIEIDHLAQARRLFARLVEATAEADLFRAPTGFNNHIAWNAAHVVCTQQLLHYKLSGLDTHLAPELIERYRKGTGPQDGDPESFREVMAFSPKAAELLREDLAAGRFETYPPYETSAGVTLSSIEEAIAFNNLHEGIHLGYIMAERRALGIA